MNRLKIFIGIGFAVAACTPEPTQSPTTGPAKAVASSINIGKTISLNSEKTGQAHQVNIWTPPNMDGADKSYPVLYVIDGGIDQDFHHISGLAQLASINGQFEVPIVVGIRTSQRAFQLTPKMTDPRYLPWNGEAEDPKMGGADDFHAFITDDVIPFIDANYPASDRKLVIGESLAGFFITREFLKYPDTFTDYIAISPSLWLDDQKLAKAAPTLLQSHKNKSRNLYLTMADEGGTMQAGLDKVLTAVNSAGLENLNLVYVDRRDSESHSTIYHGAAHDALVQLMGLPAPDYGPDPWYLREGGQPEDDE